VRQYGTDNNKEKKLRDSETRQQSAETTSENQRRIILCEIPELIQITSYTAENHVANNIAGKEEIITDTNSNII